MDAQFKDTPPQVRVERHWPCAILILAISSLIYVGSLNGQFVWDDVAQIGKNPFIRDVTNLPNFFTADLGRHTAYGYQGSSPYYRPLFLVSYSIDYLIWGSNPFGYHFTNVILHSICSLLAFGLGFQLLREKLAAFLAAVVFAVHPVHAEAVAWVAGRADLLAASLLFLSFGFYVAFRDLGRKSYFAISLLTYMLALFSKEATIPLPLLLVAYEFSFRRHELRGTFKSLSARLCLYITLFAVYLVARTAALGTLLPLPDGPAVGAGRLYEIPGIMVSYLRLFFLPVDLKLLYQIPVQHFFDPWMLLSALVALLLLAATFWLYSAGRTVFFVVTWFVITILPVLGPTGLVIMADRYLYIPSLGLSLLAGCVFSEIFYRSRNSPYKLLNLVTVAIIVALSFITIHRNSLWRSELPYYTQALADAPQLPLAYNNLGNWYVGKKMYGEAIPVLKKALELDPTYVYSRLNLGTAYLELGSYGEAISEFQKAIEIKPGLAEAHYNLGNALMQTDRMDEAIVQWQTAIRLRPDHSESNNHLGNVYLLRKDYRNAAERYTVALQGRPFNAEAHYNLALALERLGDVKGAVAHYRKFVLLASDEHKSLVVNVKRKLETMTNRNQP